MKETGREGFWMWCCGGFLERKARVWGTSVITFSLPDRRCWGMLSLGGRVCFNIYWRVWLTDWRWGRGKHLSSAWGKTRDEYTQGMLGEAVHLRRGTPKSENRRCGYVKTIWDSSWELNQELPYDLAIPLPGTDPRELKAEALMHTCIPVFTEHCSQSKSLTEGKTDKQNEVYTVE